MKNIAILGFGVVGGGITEVIEKNKEALRKFVGDEVHVKYILDLREFPDSPYGDRIVHDIGVIAEDSDVSVVCEAMGGVNPAFDYSVKLMKSGKSMVTSNKELVARRGVELMDYAKANGVQYMFEASVGGGIPEIRGMRTSLAGDTVTKIDGILNGTTNYILTRMKKDGATFASALSEAQRLGYAEKDPTADVDGLDAQRKIMILTAVATDMLVDENDVYTETMTKITPEDMDAARRWGGTVKLIGSSRIADDRSSAALYVCPTFVPSESPLSFIDDVYNGISVYSPVTSDVMFYGRGAGRMPTAGAVVADVASILSGLADKERACGWSSAPEGFAVKFENLIFSYFVRVKTDSPADALETARQLFGGADEIPGAAAGYVEYITAPTAECEAQKFIADGCGGEVVSVIRVLA